MTHDLCLFFVLATFCICHHIFYENFSNLLSFVFIENDTNNEEDDDYHYGTYKEYKEMAFQQSLATEIKELVENQQNYHIKISDYLTLRTAGDIVNLSKYEPYGLKGCKVIILIEDFNETINLGCMYPEKGIISTFEITLVLHIKKNPCRRLPFFNCKPNEMVVLEQYELRKEKMYTSKNRRKSPTLRNGLTN